MTGAQVSAGSSTLVPPSQDRGLLSSPGFQARLWVSELSLPGFLPQLQMALKVVGKDLSVKF